MRSLGKLRITQLYVSISTSFCLDDKPDLILIFAFGRLNFSANSLISSSFAFPSTGSKLRLIVKLPSGSSLIFCCLEKSLTLTFFLDHFLLFALGVLGLREGVIASNCRKHNQPKTHPNT